MVQDNSVVIVGVAYGVAYRFVRIEVWVQAGEPTQNHRRLKRQFLIWVE